MKALRAPLLTLLALASGVPTEGSAASVPSRPALPSGWTAKLAALAPLPGQSVQLLEKSSRLAFPRLQQRVMTLGGSREALAELFASVARGEMPKYDERLKISREEFGQYLVFQPILVGTGKTARLNVTREGNLLKFGPASGLPGVLRGVTLDLRSGELRTPEGFGAMPRAVAASNAPDRSIDIRGGFEWNVRGNNPVTQNGINAQLQLLQLPDKVVLIYSFFSMLRGTISDGTVILGYTR